MFVSSRKNRTNRLLVHTGLVGIILLIAACASAPVTPTASLNAARSAIQIAERDDAGHFAAAELDQARQKLERAEKAVLNEDMVLAERLANEAAVTAKLAAARTESTKALAINDELSRGSAALLEEMQRAGERL